VNPNTKISFKLFDGWRLTVEEEFIIKDLINEYPVFWKRFENDFPAFINLCLDNWVGSKEQSGVKYKVGTFDIVDINDFNN